MRHNNKNINRIKKYIAILLAAAVTAAGLFPIPGRGGQTIGTNVTVSRAASTGNTVEREFDTLSAKFGAALNDQMELYLAGNTSGADVETDFTKKGFKSTLTFQLATSLYEYPMEKDLENAGLQLSRWLNQAIADYTSLCTLVVDFSFTWTVDVNNNRYLDEVKIYSPVAAGDIRSTTSSYRRALETLTMMPANSSAMSTAEKILLVHDRLVSTGEYGDADNELHHTPQSILLEKKGVCESYAGCFNHAMTRLGIDSLMLRSDAHEWNAARLDGKWYYIDTTWDDPTGSVPISYVGHDYFLVPPSAFTDSHTMTDEYYKTYGSILRQIGTAYDNYFPKTTRTYNDTPDMTLESKITRCMSYANGTWYYSNRIGVYTWDGRSNESTLVTDIPSGTAEVCSTVYGYDLYYSTPDGVFRYRPGAEAIRLAEGDIAAMVLRDNTLYYTKTDGVTSTIPLVAPEITQAPDRTAPPAASEIPIARPTPTAGPATPTPVPVNTPLPTLTPAPPATPDIEVVPPARVTVKSIKNVSPRGFKVKIKSVKKADGYQLSYSLNKKFKNDKKKIFTKTTVQADRLKKKKTYYVRARAYTLNDGTKYYGKWSKTNKIKIKS